MYRLYLIEIIMLKREKCVNNAFAHKDFRIRIYGEEKFRIPPFCTFFSFNLNQIIYLFVHFDKSFLFLLVILYKKTI